MSEEERTAGRRKRNVAAEASGTVLEQPPMRKTRTQKQPGKPEKRVAKVMLYTHPKVARKIKEIALHSDRKANDVYLDAIDLYLKKAGHKGVKQIIEG